MTRVSQYNANHRLHEKTSVAFVAPTHTPQTRVDIALLASALFLQRFGLPFFHTFLSLDFVFVALICVHQFATGRLFIQYDRLLWFLIMAVTAAASLLLNFESKMLTSYGLFVLVYFLFTLRRPSTLDQYKSTLQGFQFLVLILSCLAIAQFVVQPIVDGGRLIMFYGIFPDSFLPLPAAVGGHGGWNTIGPITQGSSLLKSNGIFLVEPSTMSQTAAIAILIEILEFRRPRYLILLALGLLLAYSGTGISILVLSLPLVLLVNRRAQLPVLLVSLFGFGLLATGIIDLSAFTSRVGEFDDTHASGFIRFVSSFWMTADYFNTAFLSELLFGNGPGYSFHSPTNVFYHASGDTWFNVFCEYGLIGAFVFTCFLGSCFRRSRCPKPVIAGLIYQYLLTANNLLSTPLLVIMVVLCTVSGSEPRRGRIDETGQYTLPLAARSAAS
jgi:hypothetical protein